jgi:hypothetical protein
MRWPTGKLLLRLHLHWATLLVCRLVRAHSPSKTSSQSDFITQVETLRSSNNYCVTTVLRTIACQQLGVAGGKQISSLVLFCLVSPPPHHLTPSLPGPLHTLPRTHLGASSLK